MFQREKTKHAKLQTATDSWRISVPRGRHPRPKDGALAKWKPLSKWALNILEQVDMARHEQESSIQACTSYVAWSCKTIHNHWQQIAATTHLLLCSENSGLSHRQHSSCSLSTGEGTQATMAGLQLRSPDDQLIPVQQNMRHMTFSKP